MALVDLWRMRPDEFHTKRIDQIVPLSGDGTLSDGSICSAELRQFLREVELVDLERFISNCLEPIRTFSQSGFVLQDIINEIGLRLRYQVEFGRYSGIRGGDNFDGIWNLQDRSIIVEVKTTSAYNIDLRKILDYREKLINQGRVDRNNSSMLIVLGRFDTNTHGLEDQIAARYRDEARIISVEYLVKLLLICSRRDFSPNILEQTRKILLPVEFIRVDGIIDLVFAATPDEAIEDVEEPDVSDIDIHQGNQQTQKHLSFNEECVARIQSNFNKAFIVESRSVFRSSDGTAKLICTVSKSYNRPNLSYWFAFHPYWFDYLSETGNSFIVFGCGSSDKILLIPFGEFSPMLNNLWTTERGDTFYWHIQIKEDQGKLILRTKKGVDNIDISRYLLRGNAT